MIKSLNKILVVLLFLLAVYHIAIYMNKMEIVNLTRYQLNNYIYPIHNISMNSIIIVFLIYLVKTRILPKIIYIFISYPALKIIYNACLFIPISRSVVRDVGINIWLLLLVGALLLTLIALRLFKKNG